MRMNLLVRLYFVGTRVGSTKLLPFTDITMYECLIRNHNVVPVEKLSFDAAIQQARKRKQEAALAGTKRKEAETDATDAIETMLVSKTPLETRGHTSYLTFATFLPAIENNVAEDAEDEE